MFDEVYMMLISSHVYRRELRIKEKKEEKIAFAPTARKKKKITIREKVYI